MMENSKEVRDVKEDDDDEELTNRVSVNMPIKKSANDFKFIGLIGEGSFSMVALAVNTESRKKYAIKICEKRLIMKEQKASAVMREREIMTLLGSHPSPYFVKLYFTFQDPNRLFFGLSFAKGGELSMYINKLSGFNEECTLFYAAQILMALEHLHSLGIIHRDLKPENILLSEKFHIQVTDFGSAYVGTIDSIKPDLDVDYEKKKNRISNGEKAKESSQNSGGDVGHDHGEAGRSARSNSFVGTAQYVSPEMLKQKRSYNSSDLWAYGCIIYQMIYSSSPFNDATDFLIFQRILALDLNFPDKCNSPALDLIKSFLILDPCLRLGAKDDFEKGTYSSIRSSPFFDPVRENFNNLHNMESPLIKVLKKDDLNLDTRIPCLNYDDVQPGFNEDLLLLLLADAPYKHQQHQNDPSSSRNSSEKQTSTQKKSNTSSHNPSKVRSLKERISKIFKH